MRNRHLYKQWISYFRSRWIVFWSILLMGLDWMLRFLIAWVSRMNPTLNYMSEQRYLFPECRAFKCWKTRFWLWFWDTDYSNRSSTQTGKNDRVETLDPTPNLLLHLPGHLTSRDLLLTVLPSAEPQQNGYLAILLLVCLSIFLKSSIICKALP